jgi:hypothetical protein
MNGAANYLLGATSGGLNRYTKLIGRKLALGGTYEKLMDTVFICWTRKPAALDSLTIS